MTGDLLWAYGVVPAGTTPPATGVGIAGGVVWQVESGDLVALTSAVPRGEFGAEPLREKLNDLTWLERIAREHEAVLEQVLGAATIVPLRLCTIFDDADGVRRMLEREREPLMEALQRLDGRQEWGVKLLVDAERLAATAAPAGDQAQGEGGAAYLARRRHEREAREAARALAVQIVDEVDASLQAHAIDSVRLAAQNRELSGHTGDMVLNGAYLVEGDRVDALRGCVDDLQERYSDVGARLELTGPWPPYNFVTPPATQLA